MKYIDFHCDTLMQVFLAGKKEIGKSDKTMVDLSYLKDGSCMAQFFAIFMPPMSYRAKLGDRLPGDEEYIQLLTEILLHTVEQYPEKIAIAKNGKDLRENDFHKKISAFLTLEDGRPINGKIENLERYFEMGIRLISLTWNEENCFGFPNSDDPMIMNQGLKKFGKEAVIRMQELGMIVDVSHLSDGGFWDVVSLCKLPFVASHSNSRSVCPHRRNLTDDMIHAIGEKGGIIGLNFGPEFLVNSGENKKSCIQDMIRHINHIRKYGGEDCISLGTDFDGISGEFEIEHPDKMYLLFEELHKNHFSDNLIEKIAYKNAERVIRDIMI